jgi:hypothetical protein
MGRADAHGDNAAEEQDGRGTSTRATRPAIGSRVGARRCSLPFFLALGLASFGLFESVRYQPRLLLSVGVAAAALLAWTIVLFTSSIARR